MKRLLFGLTFAAQVCSAQITLETAVEFPARYRPAEVQALIQSINYPQLAQEIDMAIPGALRANMSFYYQPIVMHPALGGPDRQAVLVFASANPGWGREPELKAFLKQYLEKRIAEANR